MASVKRRPDGKWRARYRDKAGVERAKHFDLKTEALDWIAEKTVQKNTGALVNEKKGRATLREFYADWSTKRLWADNTRAAMNLAVSDCTFADYPLNEITADDIDTWVTSMSTRLGPGTIKTRFGNVRTVLRGAIRYGAIVKDPTVDAVLPRMRRAEMAMEIPTPEQVGAILESADSRFAVYLAVCAFGGLRMGEASAVQLGDIDFLRRKLKVRRQVQRATGGAVVVSPPKYGSERDVNLPDDLVAMLARHVEDGVFGPERWLFGNGTPPHQSTVGRSFQRLTASLKMTGFTLHDLRHFYASGLIAAGCDVVTVQRALGHAKASTTLNTYSHLWPTAEDRTRTAAAGLMASTRERSGADERRLL